MNKVTLFISSLEGGGAEGVCVNIANALANRNWQVDLLVMNLNDSVYHELLDDKVNLIDLNVSNARYVLGALLRYIRKSSLDKIIVFNYELSIMLMVARFISRQPFKIIARNINTLSKISDIEENKTSYRVVTGKIIKSLYGKNDFIVNQSQGMKDDLLRFYKNIDNKTTVINNPVRKQIAEVAAKLRFVEMQKQDYILCVGRLCEQKAFHYAIEAFSVVVNDFPDLKLKILGQGKLENQLRVLVDKLGLQGKVEFLGFQKTVIDYYIDAKLVILTSLFEGFPNVLVESITVGTPIVAFDCPSGPREIIEDGKNGYLVKYLDSSDLVFKLNEALIKKWNYQKIYLSAKRFSADSIITKWESVLNYVY